MKKIPYLLLVCTLIFVSCNEETVEQVEYDNSNFLIQKITESNEVINFLKKSIYHQ